MTRDSRSAFGSFAVVVGRFSGGTRPEGRGQRPGKPPLDLSSRGSTAARRPTGIESAVVNPRVRESIDG